MPRPFLSRHVDYSPPCDYFKPAGVPLRLLDEVRLGADELEALRLADCEGLYHEAAAGRMGVSRATFGRIVESARRKVAHALTHGKAICIVKGHPPASSEGSSPAPKKKERQPPASEKRRS